MATLARHYDVHDILDKAGTGWIANPAKPQIYVEARGFYHESFMNITRTGGVILIHENYNFSSSKVSPKYENRIWTFNITIIEQSSVLLQAVWDQFREVFDRYTSVPWSTSTLGTSTTYTYALVEEGDQVHRDESYVLNCRVILAEMFVPVVIA